jgi:RimJ/RimL family protein N-acetyltransferase
VPFQPLLAGSLRLRPLTLADAPALLRYRSLPEVGRFQGFEPASLADAEAFIGALAAEPDLPGTWFQLALERRADGELLGDCGLRFPNGDRAQVELGITVAPAHQGRGHASAAVQALLGFAFGPLGKHRVQASVDPGNGPSIRLLERAGFRREGHLVEAVWLKGRWVDDLVYALLAREWRARQG